MTPEECDHWVKRAHIQWESYKETKPTLSLQVDHNGRRGTLGFMLDTGAGRTIVPMGYLVQFYAGGELFKGTYEIHPDDPIRNSDKDGWRTGICLQGKKIQRLQCRDAQGAHLYGFELPATLNIVLKNRILHIDESLIFSNEVGTALLGRSALKDLGVTFLGTTNTRYFGLFAAPGATRRPAPPRTFYIGEP